MSYIISYIQVFLISTAPGFELHFLIILDMQFHLGDATHLEAESRERREPEVHEFTQHIRNDIS